MIKQQSQRTLIKNPPKKIQYVRTPQASPTRQRQNKQN